MFWNQYQKIWIIRAHRVCQEVKEISQYLYSRYRRRKHNEKKFKSFKISKNYFYLKKLFDNEKAKVLFEQSQNNHAINLMKNTKLLYILLYNLLQKKLAEL